MSEFDWVPPSSPPEPPAPQTPAPQTPAPRPAAPSAPPAAAPPTQVQAPAQPPAGDLRAQPYAQPVYPTQPYAQPVYPTHPYGYQGYPGYPVPAGPAPVPVDRAPREAWTPRPFSQALRGPAHRWWRALVGLGVVIACSVAVALGIAVLFGVLAALGTIDLEDEAAYDAAFDAWSVGPWGILALNVVLAGLIPVAMLAVWAGHRWPPGYVSSVVGRVRWRWLFLALGVAAAVWLPVNVVLAVLEDEPLDPEPRWLLLVGVVLLTTPLQAAGEEYFFRGWLQQAVGSVIPRAAIGALVAGALSCTLFALAHGDQDPWLFGDRFVFGMVASWLVWRTGGLEAGIAMHVVNNLVAFGFGVAYGQLEESLSVTEADPLYVLVDVTVLVVAGLVLDRLARRRGVGRLVSPGWPARPARRAVAASAT